MLVRQPAAFDVHGLEALAGRRPLARVQRLVRELCPVPRNGPVIWHVNSSGFGGGVADILNSLVPLSNQLGAPSAWLVIAGDEHFFQTTKAFHNALQGDASQTVTPAMLAHYRDVMAANTRLLDELVAGRAWSAPDVIVFHDPQTAGLIPWARRRFPRTTVIWHAHIQVELPLHEPEHPGHAVWRLLRAYVDEAHAAVFHLPAYVPAGLTTRVHCFLPSVNPLGYLNRDLSTPAGARFVRGTLRKHGMEALVDPVVPLVLQVARFDPWKDPLGVIQAYREARQRLRRNGHRPHLLLAGPLAADDPEANAVLREVRAAEDGDRHVHIVPLRAGAISVTPDQAEALTALGIVQESLRCEDLVDLEINAFQTRADVVVAKSLREGFGLAITGAGYHGKARIVSQVGGLEAQVIDARGRAHAALVGGTPNFSREASIIMTRDWLVELLGRRDMRESLGARARRHVLRMFLPHRHLEDYFRLFLALRGEGGAPTEAPFARRTRPSGCGTASTGGR